MCRLSASARGRTVVVTISASSGILDAAAEFPLKVLRR